MPSKLLLLSNSTQSGGKYLEIWANLITSFLKENQVKTVTFVPFAGVTIGWDSYADKVREALPDFTINSIHNADNMKDSVASADAIIIGGGNTFNLLYKLQEFDLLGPIRQRVVDGVPYIGWSAGSNVAAPDIGTTNDMPIIWPSTDKALDLVPFNINAHFSDWKPPNYQGEGRSDRLNEAITVKRRPIVALSEATGILVQGDPSSFMTRLAPRSLLPETANPEIKVWLPSKEATGYKVVDADLSNPMALNDILKQ
ncbi:Peptidase E [Halotydeus destructor]|nr:Peptidase E [Halotydeus destructor]